MPVSMDVQSTISQRYAQLSSAVTHDPTQERSFLSPHFNDAAKFKLRSFEYDPLTVIVQRIDSHPDGLYVRAEYVGVHGHNEVTVDHWQMVAGQWMLAARHNP
jgi:hypothetical protein